MEHGLFLTPSPSPKERGDVAVETGAKWVFIREKYTFTYINRSLPRLCHVDDRRHLINQLDNSAIWQFAN
jgi:hypothetical protein